MNISIAITVGLLVLLIAAMAWNLFFKVKYGWSDLHTQTLVQAEKHPASKTEIILEAIVGVAVWVFTAGVLVSLGQGDLEASRGARRFAKYAVIALIALPAVYLAWFRGKLPYPRPYIFFVLVVYLIFDLGLIAEQLI